MSRPELIQGIDREAPITPVTPEIVEAPIITPVTPEIVAESQANPGLWVIFDTETTGLVNPATTDLAQQPYVIEFAGVYIAPNGDIVHKITTLFKPPIKLPEFITKITGITDEALADAKPFDCEVVSDFLSADSVTTAVAHNFTFDQSMIEFEFARAGKAIRWPKRKICTVEASMAVKGRRMKLDALHREFFGEGVVGAHRALADVEALARIVHFMRMKGML